MRNAIQMTALAVATATFACASASQVATPPTAPAPTTPAPVTPTAQSAPAQTVLPKPSKVTTPRAAPARSVHIKPSPWEREVIYQIFPRSFFDSNGDTIGDLPGIEQKLDYLQRLGVTAILLNPIFASRLYHNYFADDFMTVDPNFGTNEQFFSLVRQAHRRHLKVILDMEVQYVADHHAWVLAVQKDPKSRFAEYLTPDLAAVPEIAGYNGVTVKVTAVNPDSSSFQDYIQGVFRYWAAPKGDRGGGVDGFRIDHMMDDLDNKKIKTGMLKKFWSVIEEDVWKVKPATFFLGEQADWGTGADLFAGADVNAVYDFGLRAAIASLDKTKIDHEIQLLATTTPPGKTQVVFIESHDTNRFASEINGDPGVIRLGAVLNLTLGGTPYIYYGQELGMRGKKLMGRTDGVDIPNRLAFRWSAVRDAPGTCIWYRNTGTWWSTQFSADKDGISLAEEEPLTDSVYNFYRRLIELRRRESVLQDGTLVPVTVENPKIVAFERQSGGRRVLVAVNLGTDAQTWNMDTKDRHSARDLWDDKKVDLRTLTFPPHGFMILEIK